MFRQSGWNVLCIGINNYSVGAEPLKFCVRDALGVFEAFRERTRGQHQLVQDPTSAQLQAAIEGFVDNSRLFQRNLLFAAGHCFQHEGKMYLKAPDSDTFSADVCVDKVYQQLPNGSLFVCFLNGCRVDVTLAIEAPRMVVIMPKRESAREVLRRRLRIWQRMRDRREYFYLFPVLAGEQQPDDNDIGVKFANIIRTQLSITIEQAALQLRRCGGDVHEQSNLDRWSGCTIGQDAEPRLSSWAVLAIYTLGMVAVFNIFFMMVLLRWHTGPSPPFLPPPETSSYCYGPFLNRSSALDLVKVEEDLLLKAFYDDVISACLADLYWHRDEAQKAKEIACRLCSASKVPLAKAFACEMDCYLSIGWGSSSCLPESAKTEAIACTSDEAGSICMRARLRAAAATNLQAWRQQVSGQRKNPKMLLRTLNHSSVPHHIRLPALEELADCELASGDLTVSVVMQMLIDLLPQAELFADMPLLRIETRFVFMDYMEALLRTGFLTEAKPWFYKTLELSPDDVRPMFVMGGAILRRTAGEAIHWNRLGVDLLRQRDDRLNMPACHDQLALAQNSEVIINSTCLQQELMEKPFLFDAEEAHLLAHAPALRASFT